MLASDSDSEFEYPEGANSDASSDDLLKGKLALGIDPHDTKFYDVRKPPQNGSQYLLKVMSEKKMVPKVAYADSIPPVKIRSGGGDEVCCSEGAAGGNNVSNYLDRFLQSCSAFREDEDNPKQCSKLLPSVKWREEVISSFSETRARIEQWQYKIEAKEIKIAAHAKMSEINENDNMQCQKFCYGLGFSKLGSVYKSKTPQQKVVDFFIDLYDTEAVASLFETVASAAVPDPSMVKSEITSTVEENNSRKQKNSESEISDADVGVVDDALTNGLNDLTVAVPDIGHRPLMSLVMQFSQNRLEKLVRWNLVWLKNTGFINECQGQWLYSILACIAKPVDPSVMSDLRSIARIFLELRNSVSEWDLYQELTGTIQNSSEIDDSQTKVDAELFDYVNTLNLLIYIIADYFQQKDLILHL